MLLSYSLSGADTVMSVIGARLFDSASTASVRNVLSVGWSLPSDSAAVALPAASASRYDLTGWAALGLAGGGAALPRPEGAEPPVAGGSTGPVADGAERLTSTAAAT